MRNLVCEGAVHGIFQSDSGSVEEVNNASGTVSSIVVVIFAVVVLTTSE